jgi:hypothetical protein
MIIRVLTGGLSSMSRLRTYFTLLWRSQLEHFKIPTLPYDRTGLILF